MITEGALSCWGLCFLHAAIFFQVRREFTIRIASIPARQNCRRYQIKPFSRIADKRYHSSNYTSKVHGSIYDEVDISDYKVYLWWEGPSVFYAGSEYLNSGGGPGGREGRCRQMRAAVNFNDEGLSVYRGSEFSDEWRANGKARRGSDAASDDREYSGENVLFICPRSGSVLNRTPTGCVVPFICQGERSNVFAAITETRALLTACTHS
ncbi:hypothetical protein SCHPADRAFT_182471 [Schizopora paradoxa]|uniref:Uncharacterized protein n=1 Tax=Schizopora paradoxa TaxID=27342 RepID=A0A0H2S650_9AGAM|nr:hypothetical protein SCHPADRAFT_182471 [Schizopora paradoxa]